LPIPGTPVRGINVAGIDCTFSIRSSSLLSVVKYTAPSVTNCCTKAPIQLLAVSPSGRHQDVAQGIGGNIYVFSAHVGVDQARVNRFAVQGIYGNPTQSDTIQVFNDLFIQNTKSFFLGFGAFVQQFVTDGAVYFTTESKEDDRMLKVQSIPATLIPRTGVPGIGNRVSQVPILFGSGTQITTLARNIGSGSWLLTGDFGLRVHE